MRDALALIDLAERVNIPVDELSELLATLEAQPIEARERFLRGFVEAWLMQQREIYDTEQHGGEGSEGVGGRQTVPLEEVGLAQAFPLEALINVLERQGLLQKAEVLEEIKALQAKTPNGR